ncbi:MULTISPECIES: thiamine pyrophosphate-binding protein [Streptomyces]|uniref:Acetolactate synthase n=2 Tax=Streptomyces rimosus subsp. rimosus TaxID=132474 RepID=A0A8A1UWK0_STRR1|nr:MULTISPECIES: thiamine pyrophosphate-binding protein [Streptomyces]KOG67503.1 acetolactate synthase [Kitasatospora aureofaciens]KEF09246.1 acetolactate synthase [Streptomyces rimosus]KEF19260.1 acetolactate synthase [Streptomyces rimosus]KOT29402.1 acetolactate synthase [Streptomyces sp. NRRL WC-3701]KOT45894.1 acetolactate synthase [Streptomyces rimosus subsp. rimosus]
MPDDTPNPDTPISGGHLVAKALKAEGVDVIYTLCGGHIIDIYDGCVDEGIDVVDVRHEQVAAHAADAHARITGRPGCAVVTAGPGTTDAVTGVANALRAESPMLLIGGQGALGQHKMGSLQDLPHVEMMTPVTKFAATVPDTARVADMVSMAFRECFHGAPGPSFLEIPRDVLDAKVPRGTARVPRAGHYRASTRSAGDPDAVERLAELLVRSEKPAVLLGGQVWTTRGTDAAAALVRDLNLPAYMNGAGRGSLPPGDPHHFQLSRRHAFTHADLIVVVGTPFDFRMGYGKRLSPAATVVQIDLDYRTVGRNRDVDLGIVGDAGLVLAAAAQAASGRLDTGAARRKEWIEELRAVEEAAVAKRLPLLRSDAAPIHPYRLVAEIDDFLTEDSVFIGDGGDIVTFSGQVVRPKAPGHWMDPGPLGTLGVGVPFVLAAKRAQPDKEVVALFGDGAFSLTGWDFETLVRFGLPFVGIVGNNSSMNQIRYGQRAKYGEARERIGNTLGDVPYDAFARMLGGYGEEVRDPAQIRPALERARRSGLPSLINVWVDPDAYAPGTVNQTMYK